MLRPFRDIAQNDIAILKLKTSLIFNKRVSAITLPQQNEIRTGNAVLSGWGFISKDLIISFSVLQKVTVPLLDNQSCLEKIWNNGKKPNLYDTQICTDAVEEIAACYVNQNFFASFYFLFLFLLHLIKLSY